MDIESICDLADKKIQLSDSSLKDFREGHLRAFREKNYSSPVADGYKFTNLERFFSELVYQPQTTDQGLQGVISGDFPTLFFHDGLLTDPVPALAGVTVTKLKDQFSQVRNSFQNSNALSHLHHGLMDEGVVIEVQKDSEIETPIRIIHLSSKSGITAPTIFIIARPFSRISILEESLGEVETSYAQVNETYIVAHPGAVVEHIQLTQGSALGLHHGSVFAEVEKDATVKSFIFNTSGKLTRKNLTLNLNASGANGESYALFLTNKTEHSDINTTIGHRAADTTSTQVAKGILDGESRGIFTGLIHIYKDSQRVASSQVNKNLLLSKKAQVHSQPQLEIFADDVKCSHGSTTGQLSDDEVFYFQARGIPAEKARTLLAHGFGMEVVGKIHNKKSQTRVSSVILSHLETKFALKVHP
ncbi:MAG TPA: Fe-S cluster assembly protein SufD [Bacteriovoracaceae bacterium]|nr:Fe-S cluster assembly protein SufD [Bacteriovoracaceae bacterium]